LSFVMDCCWALNRSCIPNHSSLMITGKMRESSTWTLIEIPPELQQFHHSSKLSHPEYNQ
jgi:hypothetical protein